MTRQRFTHENTDGYTDEELTELNRRWQIACDQLDPEHRQDERHKDEVAKRVLARFDAQRSPLSATEAHYKRHDVRE